MKYFGILIVLTLSLAMGCAVAAAQTGQHEGPLTNQAVVKLTKAGFKEKTILSIIDARLPSFELSPDKLIELKHNGVTEKVIVAMLARQEGLMGLDDSFGDDSFMSSPELRTDRIDPNGNASSTPDNSTNIFGSSGGTKGRTRSRSNTGSIDNDTQTVGSATVRILRPPTEAGGAGPTKLEKTKSLTNDSIVELVEAGFSEGTIIRRIEQSPVEFDLAAPKVEDLRKRRVSEKILTAMKTAMGDDSTK